MVRDIMPWRRRKDGGKLSRPRREDEHPFAALQREMNQLFDDFFGDWGMQWSGPRWSGLRSQADAGAVSVDVAEDENEVRVVADVPGMEEKDIEVELNDNLLTIHGEKHHERDEKKRNYHLVERTYGAFHRSIPLPGGLEEEQAKARFKNGVLTVTIPKSAEARTQRKQIPVASD